MINKQFKFEGKIQNGFKNLTPRPMFQGQFDLEDQGQVHQVSNSSETCNHIFKVP